MSEPLELGIQPQMKLTIALDPSTGQVNVNGPIGDRLLCFGLLEMAKEAINAHALQAQKQILVARPMLAVKQ